jgi:hypothetical protein
MDKEFHYYITYFIALRAGFNEQNAYIIAYSSQYTDDNNVEYVINPDTSSQYHAYISQTYDIFKPREERLRIYPVFHFMPGSGDELLVASAKRKDGKTHLLNTIPNNKNAQLCLTDALDSRDLYQTGIATHVYTDTFAHKNFVGCKDDFNDIRGILGALTPSIGHADAQVKPDAPTRMWKDKRLIEAHEKIDNKVRFLDAAGWLYDIYTNHLGTRNFRKKVVQQIDEAIGNSKSTVKERTERYKALIGPGFIEYKKKAWFKEAVRFDTRITCDSSTNMEPRTDIIYLWKDNYRQSYWYKFQEAVKAHQKFAMYFIGPILDSLGVRSY